MLKKITLARYVMPDTDLKTTCYHLISVCPIIEPTKCKQLSSNVSNSDLKKDYTMF